MAKSNTVKTKLPGSKTAGFRQVGSYLKIKDDGWYHVEEDGNLTKVDTQTVQRIKNNNIQKSRDNLSVFDWFSLPKAIIKRNQNAILRNTEGMGNVLADGISILTSKFRGNTYYDGKLHTPRKHLVERYTNPVKDNNRNIINLYTDKNDKGFQPSSIGQGRYSDHKKFGNLPAYEGKFYGDTIYVPTEAKQTFLNNIGKSYNIYKDAFTYSTSNNQYDNTDDVRHHYITFENNNNQPTVLLEDIWDSTKWLNKLNYPFILNQRVPIIFTNNKEKLSEWKGLSNWFLDPKDTHEE